MGQGSVELRLSEHLALLGLCLGVGIFECLKSF